MDAPEVPLAESTTRLEAFSDGVFAIAITLLVLEIRVPHPETAAAAGHLWAGLAALWPSYLAFLFSFFVILVMWVNHHELMRLVRAVDYPLLFANGLVLLLVTFVPFPTAVLAQHLATSEATAAVAFYCGTFFLISLGLALPDDRPPPPLPARSGGRDGRADPAGLRDRADRVCGRHGGGIRPRRAGPGLEHLALDSLDPALLPVGPGGG